MRTIEETVAALRQPGVPLSAKLTFRYSNGICAVEKQTTITLQELQQLAQRAWGAVHDASAQRRATDV